MISGRFGSIGELLFDIELVANDGAKLLVESLLDTGFTTGWLAVDTQDAESLDWTLIDIDVTMQTAKGEQFFDLYEGKVFLDSQEFIIPVHASIGVQEIILGV